MASLSWVCSALEAGDVAHGALVQKAREEPLVVFACAFEGVGAALTDVDGAVHIPALSRVLAAVVEHLKRNALSAVPSSPGALDVLYALLMPPLLLLHDNSQAPALPITSQDLPQRDASTTAVAGGGGGGGGGSTDSVFASSAIPGLSIRTTNTVCGCFLNHLAAACEDWATFNTILDLVITQLPARHRSLLLPQLWSVVSLPAPQDPAAHHAASAANAAVSASETMQISSRAATFSLKTLLPRGAVREGLARAVAALPLREDSFDVVVNTLAAHAKSPAASPARKASARPSRLRLTSHTADSSRTDISSCGALLCEVLQQHMEAGRSPSPQIARQLLRLLSATVPASSHQYKWCFQEVWGKRRFTFHPAHVWV